MATVQYTVALAKPNAWRAYAALVFGVLGISFTAIFTKWAGMPGPVAASYRMATAALVLTIPLYLRRGKGSKITSGRHLMLPLAAGVIFAVNLGLLNSALLLTSAATATLLDNMAPVWVGIGATLIFRERLTGRYWAGLAVALGGAAVVTGAGPATLRHINPGDLIALVGGVFYAGYLLVTQRVRRDLDALTYLWLVVVCAAVSLVAGSLLLGLPFTGYETRSYLALVAAGIVSQSGGWLLINYALGYLPASSAVIVLLAQPVITGLLSIPLLGESISTQQVAGGVLVLAGIYLCLLRERAGKAEPDK